MRPGNSSRSLTVQAGVVEVETLEGHQVTQYARNGPCPSLRSTHVQRGKKRKNRSEPSLKSTPPRSSELRQPPTKTVGGGGRGTHSKVSPPFCLPVSLFPDRSRVCRARRFPIEGESEPEITTAGERRIESVELARGGGGGGLDSQTAVSTAEFQVPVQQECSRCPRRGRRTGRQLTDAGMLQGQGERR